jgi:hypothetical protein
MPSVEVPGVRVENVALGSGCLLLVPEGLTYARRGAFIGLLTDMRTKKTRRKDAPGKLFLYEMLCGINRGFEQVLRDLERLQQSGPFRGHRFMKSCQSAVEETQAWTSLEMLETLHELEESDWARLGQLRNARDRKLNDPGDVLINAERRSRKPRSRGPER